MERPVREEGPAGRRGHKTTAARRGGLSRETMYQRLRTIERLLDRDLESGEQRTQLHAALTALDVLLAHCRGIRLKIIEAHRQDYRA
ncbi:helix-turn-helix domain-containing protein [Streptomyces sp. NPDC097610]|uniref:helix-turn-helix domain-containing protein n=1 Tax=Streptomyces sp. NPDC097610 TaxID=3157227 RepID=UPI00332772CA